jgi:tRNA(Phe) wybutosine-synthesizing methylase Tyw3
LTTKSEHEKRIDKFKKLLGCKKDIELAKLLETQQPQIARWRRGGIRKSMASVIDVFNKTVSRNKRKINSLKKELAELKKTCGDED